MTPKVKICRVTSASTIQGLSALGAEYVGLHLVSSPTEEKLEELLGLFHFCKGPRVHPVPVLVTKHQTLNEVVRCGRILQPPLIQLHDEWTGDEIRYLRARVPLETKIIVVIDPLTQSNMWVRDQPWLADYVLLDRLEGGTGKTLPLDQLYAVTSHIRDLKIFIAGGLNELNVAAIANEFRPFGVDVQTALEVPGRKGEKDIRRTITFLNALRGSKRFLVSFPPDIPTLSLGLTDFPASDISSIDRSLLELVDVVHLDHADGSVDPRFIRDSIRHARHLHEAFPFKPYDCHFFVWNFSDPDSIREILERYQQENPFIRAAFFYVDPESIRSSLFPSESARTVAHRAQAAFGLCLQARELTPRVVATVTDLVKKARPDYVSVAGPSTQRPIDSYQHLVGPFCRFVKEEAPDAVGIILDRDVTVDRLESVMSFGIAGVVAGKSIWATHSPRNAANLFKRVLVDHESPHEP
jgi:phosphoribosylanthranilate isomerase